MFLNSYLLLIWLDLKQKESLFLTLFFEFLKN